MGEIFSLFFKIFYSFERAEARVQAGDRVRGRRKNRTQGLSQDPGVMT